MKYTKQAFHAKIIGEVKGHLWDDREAYQYISPSFPDKPNSMLDTIQKVCSPGDFQDPKIDAAQTVIQVTLFKTNRRYVRYFDISLFKSLEPFLSEED